MNFFILFFIGLLLFLLLIFGFTQTKTFRNLLKEQVLIAVNDAIYGKLFIGEIEGSVLTSLKIKDVNLTLEGDTLAAFDYLNLRFNPIQLLFDRIDVRLLEINNPQIRLLQDSTLAWNIEKLAKPTEEDTTSSEFPYSIQVNKLIINNFNVIRKSYSNLSINEKVESFDLNNLAINNLNLDLTAFVDIENNEYYLELRNFNFNSNLKHFNLKNLTGNIGVTDKTVRVSKLNLVSDNSEIGIDLGLDNLNVLGEIKDEELRNAEFSLNLFADNFDFIDVKNFVPSFDLLVGKLFVDLKVSGKLNDFYVNQLKLGYLSTDININGNVKNLIDIDKLSFDANITNSIIKETDIVSLLPTTKIPAYENLSLEKLDVKYVGDLNKFNVQLKSNVNKGFIDLNTTLDFTKPSLVYSLQFRTENLNIEPFANISTGLNLNGNIQGSGTDIDNLFTSVMIKSDNKNFINGFEIDSLDFFVTASDKKIKSILSGYLNGTGLLFDGEVDFANKIVPTYFLSGNVNNFDVSKFELDSLSQLSSNVSLSFNVKGKSFDIDSLTADIELNLAESEYNGIDVMPSDFKLKINQIDSIRSISLVSDILDFKIDGNFSLKAAIDILGYEASTIVSLVKDKIDELNPIGEGLVKRRISERDTIPSFVKSKLKFDYSFKFKDFQLISTLIGSEKLDILGSGKGMVYNDSTNFAITTDLDIDYFVNLVSGKMLYLSDINTNFKFNRDNRKLSFDNLFGSISFANKRFYSGSEIKNINADLIFNQSKLIFNTSALINGMIKAELEGKLLMAPKIQNIILEYLTVKYLDEEWSNNEDILIDLTKDDIKIKSLNIFAGKTELNCKGNIFSNGNLDLEFNILNIDGKLFSKYALGTVDKKLGMDIDFESKITGNLDEPILNATLNGNNLQYANKNLGNLVSTFEYKNSNFLFNFRFFENDESFMPTLTFNGNFPVYLGLKDVESRILQNESLEIKLTSNRFNLNTIGNILPFIVIKNGLLKSNMEISGTFNSVKYAGAIKLSDGLFTLKNNNLDYTADMELGFQKSGIEIKSCVLKNTGSVSKIGTMKATGNIYLNNFNLEKMVAKINGDLSVLSFGSKSVLPIFYGDLFISSIDEWTFTYEKNKAVFLGSIGLEETNLVFSPQQNTYTQINNNFNYIFKVDSSKIDKEEENFNRLLYWGKNNGNWQISKSESSSLEYSVKVKTLKNAKLVFVLSEATNQKLTVESVGDINYEYKNGEIRAQGEFKLLSGSKLEFIKTFDATGSIRFESDVTNPYLNVVATYRAPHTTSNGTVEDVLVKLILEGTVDELGKNLASNPNNISVYVGAKNIESGTPDNQLGAADAFSFVVIGKFVKDLTALDQTLLASQTDMILGSVLSSVASSLFGDAINNISLDQSMGYTKFSVSGRFSNFKYSIGGTTDIFKDVTGANLMIEYLFSPDFSIRLERKEPVVQTFGSEDKINELGLKYRYQF
jgi:hypothetical protein